jgi:hypothetical protein
MIRISGPIAVGAVKLKDGTDILLFGDEHQSRNGTCKECKERTGCHYITKFLDKMTVRPTELFVESFWVPNDEISSKQIKSVDVIGDIINHFHKRIYMHGSKNQKQTKGPIRVHYADIRSEPNLRDLFIIIMGIYQKHVNGVSDINYDLSLLTKHFRNVKHFKKLLDAMVLSNDYKKSIHALLSDSQYATRFISYKYSNKTVHKLRKQVLKIQDRKMRKSLLKFHQDQCSRIIKTNQEYNDVMKRARHNAKLTQEDESVILGTLMAWLTHITDMYTLARMLYYIDKRDANVFVSYAGATHTLHYLMFFMAYIQGSTMVHYQPESESKRTKRCVHLPKHYVSNLVSI